MVMRSSRGEDTAQDDSIKYLPFTPPGPSQFHNSTSLPDSRLTIHGPYPTHGLYPTHFSRSFPTQQLNNSPTQHPLRIHDSRLTIHGLYPTHGISWIAPHAATQHQVRMKTHFFSINFPPLAKGVGGFDRKGKRFYLKA